MKKTKISFLEKIDTSSILTPVMGTLLGVIVGISLVVPEGSNIFHVLGLLYSGAFGSMGVFFESLVFAVPLGITGLAIALSYKAGVFNIGCEGQIYLGAAAATFVGTAFVLPPSLSLVHILLCLLAGAAAGALWAFIPGYLRAKKGFNEIVVTMLMNYVAILFIGYLVQNPMQDKAGVFPHSAPLAESARLARLIRGSTLHQGIWVFLILVVLVYILLFKTKLGFWIRAVGFNPLGAKYAGINVARTIIVAMLLSGSLAGMAGGIEIMGVHYRLMEGFSPGYGFDAIAVALLADLNPFGIIISSLFFGALRNAANSLQIDLGIPVSFVYIIQGLAILFVIGSREMPRIINSIKRRAQLA